MDRSKTSKYGAVQSLNEAWSGWPARGSKEHTATQSAIRDNQNIQSNAGNNTIYPVVTSADDPQTNSRSVTVQATPLQSARGTLGHGDMSEVNRKAFERKHSSTGTSTMESFCSNSRRCCKTSTALFNCSSAVIRLLEEFFANHGRRVARRPVMSIVLCVFVSVLAGLGVFNFTSELRPFKLWLPQGSDFIKMLEWQNKNFPIHFRRHVVLWESSNVLTAASIKEMWRVHEAVAAEVEPRFGKTWHDVCAMVPSLAVDSEVFDEDEWELGTLEFRKRRKKRMIVPPPKKKLLDDISLSLSRDSYCRVMKDIPLYCYENGLLEIWGWRSDVIMNLTDAKVVEDFNRASVSEVYGIKTNFTSYIGKITRDYTGKIVSAGAAMHTWITQVDQVAVNNGYYEIDLISGQLVDSASMNWEAVWLSSVLNKTSRLANITAYANAASSFGRVSDDNIWGDVTYLSIGFVLMFTFVNVTLGRRNHVEQRPILSLWGMLSVGLSIFASYGICSLFNVMYNPVNSILPLLLLGLGVDDMFVIVSAWNSDNENIKYLSKTSWTNTDTKDDSDLVEKASRTMRRAGVAITATSLTDVTAFAIGASTELPALRSFCLYASVGIFAVFVLQATFFLAFLVLDEQRLRQNRNGILWCIVQKDWKPSACSQVDIMNIMFTLYGKVIVRNAARCIVFILSAIMICGSVFGTLQLKQEFNPSWFIPTDSYVADYFRTAKTYFRDVGAQSFFFFTNTSIVNNLPKLIRFKDELSLVDSVLEVESWFELFKTYLEINVEFANRTLTENLFSEAISLFLYTPTGGSFRNDIVFDGDTSCSAAAPPLKFFRIPFKYRRAETPLLQRKATDEVHSLLKKWDLPGYQGTWSEAYSIWETNAVVGDELVRNMSLTGLVIISVTILLLGSLRAAFLVLCCVAATVVGVGASMHVCDLTIDTVSCISLVLSIGLSVDYSVHIAHAFLSDRSTVDRKARVSLALYKAGPAVLQGGLSTVIPFLMLAFSNSHVFFTFFIVFTPTTILGLFYALVLLPVLLSLVGPEPYEEAEKRIVVKTEKEHINPAFKLSENSPANRSKVPKMSTVVFY